MPITKRMKGLPPDLVAAEGFMYQDWNSISNCQRECTDRLGVLLQREQEAYMLQHPEILALLKIFIAKMTQRSKRKDHTKEAALHFTRSFADLDEEVRTFLESPPDGPYVDTKDRLKLEFSDLNFDQDLRNIIIKNYPAEPWHVPSPAPATIDTESSSFISVVTSNITLPTPEPIPTPEPTISEVFYKMVSNTVDKVIYTQVDEGALLYDTAYVELMNAVEEAMEIPVIEIRADIAALIKNSFRLFELTIAEKAKIAAAEAWEKRMRKKLKRSLRRQKNFKGYETPPSSPESTISTHESFQMPPPRPCKCQPLASFNRYGKDRFGIYLPRKEEFSKNNTTTTPAMSLGNLMEGDDKAENRSLISKRSTTHSITSTKSRQSRTRTPATDDSSM